LLNFRYKLAQLVITLLVRKGRKAPAQIYYHVVPDYWRAEQKKQYLTSFRRLSEPIWRPLVTNDQYFWLISADTDEYADFLPIGTKETKATSGLDAEAIFKTYSGGVKTNRDDVVYDFDRGLLMTRVKGFIEEYNAEVDRYRRAGGKAEVDDFVRYDKVKWSESLKANLQRGNYAEYDETKIRTSLYRPFTRKYLFFDHLLNERTYVFPRIFPTPETEQENQVICLSGLGSNKPFHTLLVGYIPCLDMLEKTQCFPFYVYDADGGNRRENITDWALGRFRARYGSAGVGETTSPPSPLSEGEGEPAREVPLSFGEGLGVRSTIPESGLGVGSDITKWDIFYYVYGLLHHPGYRARYADNLRRELPRLPFAPDFWAFSQAGRRLAELHLTYEQAEPYPLEWVENPHAAMSYRVEKMRLNRDKTELRVNDWLTLKGIPPEVYEYRLGNRSALEWVIDQYQVKTDSRSGIVSDPNNPDDPEYIIRLVGQVITVSLETVAIIKALPEDFGVPG
jgi:predicted helicase